jgi:gamma-D-glutamyl-L-lysine dipeptidyl-peptidase
MIKKILIIMILTGVLSNSFGQEIYNMEKLKNLIKELKEQYAPDKRVAVFNLEVEQQGESLVVKGETNIPEVKQVLFPEDVKTNVIDSVDLLPDKELGSKTLGVITISVANIRSEAKHSAELATQAILGTPVNILKKRSGWFLVQTPDKYLGWVDDDGVAMMDKEELNKWKSVKKAIYTKRYGLAYSEKDNGSVPVSDLVEGNILELVSAEKNFYEIRFPDGRKGYVPADEIIALDEWVSEIKLSEENIVRKAITFMGVPYLWGGTSGKGVDCSGFTKTVYFMNGVILPRDASQQVHSGVLVDTKSGFENLRPGDLLFFGFKGNETSAERITHVGIYIGNMEFIHSSGMVKINSLDKTKDNFSSFRYNTFIRAKRIIGADESSGFMKLTSQNIFNQ